MAFQSLPAANQEVDHDLLGLAHLASGHQVQDIDQIVAELLAQVESVVRADRPEGSDDLGIDLLLVLDGQHQLVDVVDLHLVHRLDHVVVGADLVDLQKQE